MKGIGFFIRNEEYTIHYHFEILVVIGAIIFISLNQQGKKTKQVSQ